MLCSRCVNLNWANLTQMENEYYANLDMRKVLSTGLYHRSKLECS